MFICKRCSHKWSSRNRPPDFKPLACPKCKSYRWEIELSYVNKVESVFLKTIETTLKIVNTQAPISLEDESKYKDIEPIVDTELSGKIWKGKQAWMMSKKIRYISTIDPLTGREYGMPFVVDSKETLDLGEEATVEWLNYRMHHQELWNKK